MLAEGREENLARLKNELIGKDWFQTLPDFKRLPGAQGPGGGGLRL